MRFSKKVALEKLLFLTCFAANIRCSWYQWIQNFLAHHFLTCLHMYTHFWENGRWITKEIDFVFWWFFKIVIWRPMLKFCSFEDNRITYTKSIGSLGLCYTNAEISERKVTPWPCNNFAGQCIVYLRFFLKFAKNRTFWNYFRCRTDRGSEKRTRPYENRTYGNTGYRPSFDMRPFPTDLPYQKTVLSKKSVWSFRTSNF